MDDARRRWIESALALWNSFPVDARPRPIVLAGTMTLSSSGGFDSVEAKEAFSAGMIETEVELDPGLLERLAADAGPANMRGLTPLRVMG